MNLDDIPAVQTLDNTAFEAVWRNSRTTLEAAFQGASLATVVEDEQGIIGYQMSTFHHLEAHLARLAVHPRAQRRGVAQMLIRDLLRVSRRRGIQRVTVNTQSDNQASRALYRKMGFRETGDLYPVFVLCGST